MSILSLPLLIFVAEVCVVTLSTVRIIFVARGMKFLAPLLGFFEILIWLFAISQIMQNLSNWSCFIAFALGFTLGNYLGIIVEKYLALGTVIIRIITHRDATSLIDSLRIANFGVTSVDGEGATGRVQVVMTVVPRKRLPEVVAMIETQHSGAFYAVDEVQSASEGIFPTAREKPGIVPMPLIKMLGKAMGNKARDQVGVNRSGT